MMMTKAHRYAGMCLVLVLVGLAGSAQADLTAIVQDFQVTAGSSQVHVLDEGSIWLTDRPALLIESMPEPFQGMVGIINQQTGVNTNTSADFLTFTLAYDSDVYLVYDDRRTSKPEWVTDNFALTGDEVKLTNHNLEWGKVYKRTQPAQAGQAVVLGGNMAAGAAGEAGFNYFVFFDPIIVQEAESTSIQIGDSTTFSAYLPQYVGAVSYQWYRDGVEIPGATSATFAIEEAEQMQAGSYTVVIHDSGTDLTFTVGPFDLAVFPRLPVAGLLALGALTGLGLLGGVTLVRRRS